jgi:hypothetical protein
VISRARDSSKDRELGARPESSIGVEGRCTGSRRWDLSRGERRSSCSAQVWIALAPDCEYFFGDRANLRYEFFDTALR